MPQMIEVPNYGMVEFPDDMSDTQIVAAIKKNALGYKTKPDSSLVQNVVAGAIRGAGSIGATLLTPVDALARSVGVQNDFIGRTDRRKAMDDALSQLGADTDSIAYQGGKIGAEILGTAGAPSILAKGAMAIPALSKFVPVISSGGFNLGNAATNSKIVNAAIRTGAGAVSGGTQTLLADPDAAGTGAVIGAATPGAVKAFGAVGRGVNTLARGTVKHGLGMTTGAGGDAVGLAYQAGKKGATSFLDNMRGDVGFDDVVTQAKTALFNMRAAKNQAYRSGMMDIKNDKTILNFGPINDAVESIKDIGRFKGREVSKEASSAIDSLISKIDEWKALNPSEFHTPEGMDALKRAIGDIRLEYKPGTTARVAAEKLYNAVKNQISLQAPTYSKVMKDYSEAADLIKEIERSLSLGEKAASDTAIRKLQSILRNNATTSYGNRINMVDVLEQQGGADLLPALAGQSMNSWMPRGMSGAIQKGAIPFAAGAAAMHNPLTLIPMALSAPLASPRMVGNAAYGLGRAVGTTGNLASSGANAIGLDKLQGLLDPSIWAKTLPVAISTGQISQQ